MLRDAGKQDKAEIYELWKQSYPNQNRNYLNFYFKNIFDKGRCIALEQDQRIISSLQLNEHILRLRDKQLKISYILGVSTLPDYRRRGHMRRLMESALDEAGHNHLVTLIRGFYPKLYEQFGFETVYERKLYTVPRECLHKVSLTNISYAAEPQELLQAYQNFTKHFDGCYVRDREYYVLLLNEIVVTQKQMVVYRNRQGEVCGYLIFHKKKQEIHVEEAIYLESVVLMRLLKAAIGKEQEILVEVSQSEKLEKIFPLLIPKKQPFIMARINNPELFNKLYNLEVKSAAEAFASALRPRWIHEYY